MPPIEQTLASSAVKVASGAASNALTRWGKRKYDRFIAVYTNALSEYVASSLDQCRTVRNILYKSHSASTVDQYVNVSFKNENNHFNDINLISALQHGHHILIKGRGGAGKTMFTKWAVIQLYENIDNHQKIPVYIELRDIRLHKDFDHFEEFVFDKISNNRTKTTKNQFIEGLKAGLFILILNAADEVNKLNRHKIIKQINNFRQEFPETGILLTTREFSEIDGLSGFDTYTTTRLNPKQAISIIEKLDYREDIKKHLIDDIESKKFDRHSFFLENPLLVTILLLTFDQSREIPNKRTAFYKRAFEALYERHDSHKEGSFARDHHAGLPMDEFERLFSVFCYGTYINSTYDFSDSELVSFMKTAAKEIGIDQKAKDIARDAIESACLLTREGHDIVFVHRSFQEYFACVYIKDYRDDDIEDVIGELIAHSFGENVLGFLHELDQISLEKNYILPNLKRLIKKIPDFDQNDPESIAKILSLFFSRFRININDGFIQGVTFSKVLDGVFLMNISSAYPEADAFRILSGKRSDHNWLNFFQNINLEKVKTSRSSKPVRDEKKSNLIDVFINKNAVDWISETDLAEKLQIVIRDIKALEKSLTDKYENTGTKVRARFKDFSKHA